MSSTQINIKTIDQFETDLISQLVTESLADNVKFLQRLCDEYHQGINRFDRAGEKLFVANTRTDSATDDRVIGICGLNIDPFLADVAIGRVRHLYVLKSHRRSGVGQQLMTTLIEQARAYFYLLTLRTDNAIADQFYRSLGFQITTDLPQATHILKLK